MAYPYKFKLEHNGNEWPGSFQAALAAALVGLLDSGPITAELLLRNDDDPRWAEYIVVGYDERCLYTREGPIDRWNDLLGMAVG